MSYKILKQLIPAPSGSDPSWAQRKNVWVEKLTSEDTIWVFNTESEANTKKNELTEADSTNRIYKVVQS
mgnify:CR=1 FL=1|tara:strand:+ start:436 stop:642 length:207 start_codon:yes stop_codon:yes gene_type:complete